MNSIAEQCIHTKSSHPHVLMELSKVEYKRYKDNIIHLSGLNEINCKKEIIYNKALYGKGIKMKKTIRTHDTDSFRSNELVLTRMKGSFAMIIANKEECSRIDPELLNSSARHNLDPSGFVVLMTIVFKNNDKSSSTWDYKDTQLLRSCKPNILVSSKHHGSTGYYSSFGNKASYDKVVDSSVGQYAIKKNVNENKQEVILQNANIFEARASKEIDRSVNDLSKVVPLIRYILSPVIQSAYNLQRKIGNIQLKESLSSNNGCWQKSICINAETKDYHVEKDCTYTLISIPKQLNLSQVDLSSKYQFYFKLTETEHIHIPLKAGISFFFSGTYLTHRQNKDTCQHTTDNDFINIASYGNKRLFSHIRQSFKKLT